MEREIDLSQISDGRFYLGNDMVKAGCMDCADCSLCCRKMGTSIILDPFDLYQLEKGLNTTFEKLMQEQIELNMVDGMIHPNLKMQGIDACCSFLNDRQRCSIHEFRPGFCRMFPLGRIYENHGFRYFLQVHECPYPQKTKVKVKKWIGIDSPGVYERYVTDWHFFLKDVQAILHVMENEELRKSLLLRLLNEFYVNPYDSSSAFYDQFYMRLSTFREKLSFYRS